MNPTARSSRRRTPRRPRRQPRAAGALLALLCAAGGCALLERQTDRDVARLIEHKQRAVLGATTPLRLERGAPGDARPSSGAYDYSPGALPGDLPVEFREVPPPAASLPSQAARPADGTPTESGVSTAPTSAAASTGVHAVQRFRQRTFTLTDALAYAQRYQRAFQTAKEDLYLAALALTLERHLWTPIFAADLRTVYGNFGEITDFDQAMRFVADLRASQRLPYGGEFTAQVIETLIRDVKKTITAEESGQATLALNVPLLRNAGHVAREDLIQLERALTYAVRSYERFRRRQLVEVMSGYFDLLSAKQAVLDAEASYANFVDDFLRAEALEAAEMGTLIDTGRAELALLRSENGLANNRERFRAEADRFKLLIGMPVDEPLGLDDLQSIEEIERQVEAGVLPLLRRPAGVENEEAALSVATGRRLDLLNARDQIDDARRGVAIAQNRLLPDFDFNSSVTFDTDPEHFKLGGYEFARATWRSELLLSLPLERTAERNEYRRSLIDVQRAQRAHREQADEIRAEVRSAINQIRLAEQTLRIQERSVEVAEQRREFAGLEWEEGRISNRDKVEAEEEWNDARNNLSLAKTSRWRAILEFRLATDTLLIDESGAQTDVEAPEPDPREPDAREPGAREPGARKPDPREPDARKPDARDADRRDGEAPGP